MTRFLYALLVAFATSFFSLSFAANPPAVLLISIDGLRPSDINETQMPALNALANRYVRAEGMRPSYPSLTFPNHYTVVTGKRPDHHGIVHNTMEDSALGKFRISDRNAVGNGAWWEGGTPVWVSVQRAGQHAATMFWPGSEAAIHGIRPSYWHVYDESISAEQRIAQVMQWLQLPEAQRPRFMTLYFEHVDKASHDHGPDSEQAVIARRHVDAMLQSLLQHLTDAGFDRSVNLILVSDHGFEAVPSAQTLDVSQLISRDIAELVSIGQILGFRPQPGKTEEAEKQLLGEHAHYTCWRKTELPANWHYGTHPRIPPIVCQVEAGWDALWTDKFAQRQQQNTTHGSHGFDPELTAMRASFIAAGPAFAEGVTLPLFDNVNVYPLLMHLLQLDAEPNDGDIIPLLPALKSTP